MKTSILGSNEVIIGSLSQTWMLSLIHSYITSLKASGVNIILYKEVNLRKVIKYIKHKPNEYTSDLKGLWFILFLEKFYNNSGARKGIVPDIVEVCIFY